MKKKLLKIKPEVRQALKNLGFTDYLINIYIGLLKEGEMDARVLSELTGVPYSRVYEVLNEMVRQNIIIKLEGRPSTFIANDPKDVYTYIKKRQEHDFQENAEASLPYLKSIFGDKQPARQEQITIYQGIKPTQDHIRSILNSTSRQLCLAIDQIDELFPLLEMHLDFLQTKGVEMRFIFEHEYLKNRNVTLKKLSSYGKISYLQSIDQIILISDQKIGIQGIEGKFDIANPKEKEISLFSSTSAIYIMYLQEIFEKLWIRGTLHS